MKVLVTGGAGYIGSHAVKALLEKGHEVVACDNLSTGFRNAIDVRAAFERVDTSDTDRLAQIMAKHEIEAVMHFAAFIEVGESVKDPLKYYFNNFCNAISLFKAMATARVKKIIFSSTAAVYGNPTTIPISESHERNPINPYGRSKHMVESALEDFAGAHEVSYVIFRYFNVAGAWPDASIGEAHEPESHLIPRILKAQLGERKEPVNIFGTDYPTPDGTCIRDYVHVVDLAMAHVLALEPLGPKGRIYNLGSERGFSILEVIKACEDVTGASISCVKGPRRAGDPSILIASRERACQELKWEPQFQDLKQILRHAWNWHRSHPKGYG